MKKFLIVLFAVTVSTMIYAQKTTDVFHGAEATLSEYKALYLLNQSDDRKIRLVFKNINNALEDPRLKGKLQIELIAFGDGTEVYKKSESLRHTPDGIKKQGCDFSPM